MIPFQQPTTFSVILHCLRALLLKCQHIQLPNIIIKRVTITVWDLLMQYLLALAINVLND